MYLKFNVLAPPDVAIHVNALINGTGVTLFKYGLNRAISDPS